MKFRAFSAFAVVSLMATGLFAQTQPEPPPKVFRIYREDVKPGMAAAHAKIEAGWPKAFAKANAANYYVAATSVAGANEALFFEPSMSFAALEKTDNDLEKNALLSAELERLSDADSRVLNNSRTWLALLNEELSRPGTEPFQQMRYIMMTTYRIKPGNLAKFTEFRKLVKANQDKLGSPVRYLVYNVISGAPTGTVIVLRSIKSLSVLDPTPNAPTTPADTQKAINELASECLITADNSIYSIKPGLSHVPKEFAAADPSFWAPKPKPAVKAAVKKEAKPAGGQ